MTTHRPPRSDLYLALACIAALTLGYAALSRGGRVRPGSGWGLALGVAALLLMAGAQTLYSARKRWPGFNLGPMGYWLRGHIVLGLVGPFLALLHSGWRFNGIAGLAVLVMGVVVLSGLVGRYIYTAIPRSLDEQMTEIARIEEEIDSLPPGAEAGGLFARHDALLAEVRAWERARWALSFWHALHLPLTGAMFALVGFHVVGALYYSTFSR